MTGSLRILPNFLLVATALVFFGCDSPAPTDVATEGSLTATTATNGGIVFVRIDSLQTGYTVIADELARLEENYNTAQANAQQQMGALQSEVQSLQNKIQQGLMAPNKIQSEQQRIGRKEQEIAQQNQIALNSIQQDQMRLQQQFSDQLKEVLDAIQEEENYDYILSRGPGSGVLIGNDALDITPEVLVRLNAVQDSIQ